MWNVNFKCELRKAMKNIKCQNYSELAPKLLIRQFGNKLKRWQWRTVADRQFDVKLQMNEFGSLSTRQAIYMLFLCKLSFVLLATKLANEKIRKCSKFVVGSHLYLEYVGVFPFNRGARKTNLERGPNSFYVTNVATSRTNIVKAKFNPFNAFCCARWRMTPIIMNAVASILQFMDQ